LQRIPAPVIGIQESPRPRHSVLRETFDRPIDMGGVDEAMETEFVEPS